jgi:hypothetical protein
MVVRYILDIHLIVTRSLPPAHLQLECIFQHTQHTHTITLSIFSKHLVYIFTVREDIEMPTNTTIIWIPLDYDIGHITERENCKLVGNNNSKSAPWLSLSTVKSIEAAIGTEYAFHDPSSKRRYMHQSMVTLEILRQIHGYNVRFAKNVSEAVEIARSLGAEDKSLVLLLYLEQGNPMEHMQVYNRLTHEVGSIYPSYEEDVQSEFKVYDIKTLDKIARETGTWRPKTCFFESGKCPLGNVMTVTKRSHSSGSTGVRIWDPWKRDGRAMCKLKHRIKRESEEHEKDDDLERKGYYQWIHQEFVPSLMDWGELRVFIATRRANDGSRQPYVFHVIRTIAKNWENNDVGSNEGNSTRSPGGRNKKRRLDDEEVGDSPTQASQLLVKSIAPNTTLPEHKHLDYKDVEAFAIQTYRRLQDLNCKGLESLKVGARLDIGISPQGDGFFVNEITRWYIAHYFSEKTLKEPYDKICRTYAQAFSETLESERIVGKKVDSSHCQRSDERPLRKAPKPSDKDALDVITRQTRAMRAASCTQNRNSGLQPPKKKAKTACRRTEIVTQARQTRSVTRYASSRMRK